MSERSLAICKSPLIPLCLVGDDLLRWQIEAIPQAALHQADFESFDRFLRRQRPQDVQEWEIMTVNWERRRQGPNPYVLPKTSKLVEVKACTMLMHLAAVTRADIQLRYLTAENAAIADGNVAGHDGTAVGFIVLGLEIREAQ